MQETNNTETHQLGNSDIFTLISNKPFNLIFGVSKVFIFFNIAVFFILTMFFDSFFTAVIYNVLSYIWANWVSRTNPDIFNIFLYSFLFTWKYPITTGSRTWEP